MRPERLSEWRVVIFFSDGRQMPMALGRVRRMFLGSAKDEARDCDKHILVLATGCVWIPFDLCCPLLPSTPCVLPYGGPGCAEGTDQRVLRRVDTCGSRRLSPYQHAAYGETITYDGPPYDQLVARDQTTLLAAYREAYFGPLGSGFIAAPSMVAGAMRENLTHPDDTTAARRWRPSLPALAPAPVPVAAAVPQAAPALDPSYLEVSRAARFATEAMSMTAADAAQLLELGTFNDLCSNLTTESVNRWVSAMGYMISEYQDMRRGAQHAEQAKSSRRGRAPQVAKCIRLPVLQSIETHTQMRSELIVLCTFDVPNSKPVWVSHRRLVECGGLVVGKCAVDSDFARLHQEAKAAAAGYVDICTAYRTHVDAQRDAARSNIGLTSDGSRVFDTFDQYLAYVNRNGDCVGRVACETDGMAAARSLAMMLGAPGTFTTAQERAVASVVEAANAWVVCGAPMGDVLLRLHKAGGIPTSLNKVIISCVLRDIRKDWRGQELFCPFTESELRRWVCE